MNEEVKIPSVEEVISANPWMTSDKSDYNYYYHQAIIKQMRSKRHCKKISIRNFGSLTNYIMANSRSRNFPKVGDGATISYWSDRCAYYVAEADPKNLIVGIKRVNCKFIGKCYGDEEYEYKDSDGNWLVNPNSQTEYFKFKMGKWRRCFPGVTNCGEVVCVSFGIAEEYRDPSF